MQLHYKPDPKKVRKPVTRSSPEGLQPANLLSSSSADPSVFIMNNSVLTGQLDQNLQNLQGLVGQAILPAAVSGRSRVGGCPGMAHRAAPMPGWEGGLPLLPQDTPSCRRRMESSPPTPVSSHPLFNTSALGLLSFLMAEPCCSLPAILLGLVVRVTQERSLTCL